MGFLRDERHLVLLDEELLKLSSSNLMMYNEQIIEMIMLRIKIMNLDNCISQKFNKPYSPPEEGYKFAS